MDINRRTAYKTLLDIEKEGAYSNLALNENIKRYSPNEHSFVREIVYGTLKNKYLLDYFLKKYINRGFDKLKPEVITLLRMGAYQIIFMDSVPGYAAVSETVELAKKNLKGREAFINGVLRSVSRESDKLEFPAAEEFEEFSDYLSVRYSINKWLADAITDTFGESGAENYLKYSNNTPELSVRVNLLKTSREKLASELIDLGFGVRHSHISDRCLIVSGSGVLDTDLFRSGHFSVQDEASCYAADVLDPRPGMFVIDVCAAPGGKTAAFGELMENKGHIIAFDIYEHKLNLIRQAVLRSGIGIADCEKWDSTLLREEYIGKADMVLCDVPCSGLGVIRRKPEIKYRDAYSLEELEEVQYKILETSSSYLKPGGSLVYSTCTVDRKENHEVTDRFINNNRSFSKVYERQMGPEDGTDGFYISRIIREA